MRREIITWSVVAAILLGAFGFTVLILNNTLYNAPGFVTSYLSALERKDAAGALEIVGGLPEGTDASDTLLRRDVMPDLTNVSVKSDTELPGRLHQISVSYEIDGTPGSTDFVVVSTGRAFGLFPEWEFVEGPISTVYVTVVGDARFTANGLDLVTPTPDDPAGYLAFTPGAVELSHATTFLDAPPITVPVDVPGASIPTAVVVQPNAHMIELVQEDVNALLDTCATQEILMPTGCPFGQSMTNRVASTPKWSITQYPEVSIRMGSESGEWIVPNTPGTAHLFVDVRSLFDGSLTTFDEDVPFSVNYRIAFLPGDELLITGGV